MIFTITENTVQAGDVEMFHTLYDHPSPRIVVHEGGLVSNGYTLRTHVLDKFDYFSVCEYITRRPTLEGVLLIQSRLQYQRGELITYSGIMSQSLFVNKHDAEFLIKDIQNIIPETYHSLYMIEESCPFVSVEDIIQKQKELFSDTLPDVIDSVSWISPKELCIRFHDAKLPVHQIVVSRKERCWVKTKDTIVVDIVNAMNTLQKGKYANRVVYVISYLGTHLEFPTPEEAEKFLNERGLALEIRPQRFSTGLLGGVKKQKKIMYKYTSSFPIISSDTGHTFLKIGTQSPLSLQQYKKDMILERMMKAYKRYAVRKFSVEYRASALQGSHMSCLGKSSCPSTPHSSFESKTSYRTAKMASTEMESWGETYTYKGFVKGKNVTGIFTITYDIEFEECMSEVHDPPGVVGGCVVDGSYLFLCKLLEKYKDKYVLGEWVEFEDAGSRGDAHPILDIRIGDSCDESGVVIPPHSNIHEWALKLAYDRPTAYDLVKDSVHLYWSKNGVACAHQQRHVCDCDLFANIKGWGVPDIYQIYVARKNLNASDMMRSVEIAVNSQHSVHPIEKRIKLKNGCGRSAVMQYALQYAACIQIQWKAAWKGIYIGDVCVDPHEIPVSTCTHYEYDRCVCDMYVVVTLRGIEMNYVIPRGNPRKSNHELIESVLSRLHEDVLFYNDQFQLRTRQDVPRLLVEEIEKGKIR